MFLDLRRNAVRSARLTALLGLVAAGVIAGCSARGEESLSATLVPESREIDFVSPVVRGAENGLEMHWWVVRGEPGLLRESLRSYSGEPCGVDDGTRERLAAAGLRLVRVPLEDLTAIRAGLPVMGRTERKWLGQAPWWIESLRGALTGESLFASYGRLMTLPSGRLRVLTRAWTSPGVDGPVMRADLAIQHLPRLSELLPNLTPGDASRVLEPQHQGRVFEFTTASLEMREGYAYLLVSDDPEAEWASEAASVDPHESLYVPGRPAPEDVCGPPALSAPTPGERLLSRGREAGGRGSLTAVVVLAPRVPDTYTLLP